MSMYGRDPWGGPLEIAGSATATDDERSRDLDRAALSTSSLRPPLDETQQSWLLAGPGDHSSKKKKKYVDLGCLLVSRRLFLWVLGALLAAALLSAFVAVLVKTVPRRSRTDPAPDSYTLALRRALLFFNAQRSGRLPKHNNVSWRGDSGLKDGLSDSAFRRSLVGGFYDAGDAIKFNFPQSFALTMLSWSVIEYSEKYRAIGELDHVRGIIKWGTDYLLKTFNSSAASIDRLVAQVLLSRLRLFLSPGYPYEEMLRTFHNQTEIVMCSYLPIFTSFNRTKGGLIQLNHGRPQPLQYVVHAAFLASVFSDYLEAADIPGWYCGPNFYSTEVLRNFAKFQIDYILGKNPKKMSYVVGFGNRFPKHVHHRGASIPKSSVRPNCKGGWKWRDSRKPNPHTIIGAMVAGPDRHDGFRDVRTNYNYTEPTLAGNAGLVAVLVSLSGGSGGVDKNTIFSAVPPMFPNPPPPPAPWKP